MQELPKAVKFLLVVVEESFSVPLFQARDSRAYEMVTQRSSPRMLRELHFISSRNCHPNHDVKRSSTSI